MRNEELNGAGTNRTAHDGESLHSRKAFETEKTNIAIPQFNTPYSRKKPVRPNARNIGIRLSKATGMRSPNSRKASGTNR